MLFALSKVSHVSSKMTKIFSLLVNLVCILRSKWQIFLLNSNICTLDAPMNENIMKNIIRYLECELNLYFN
jgi:hypothetical protein